MSYHEDMWKEAKKILSDASIEYTPHCNKMAPEFSACRYTKTKRTCLQCAIYIAKDAIWNELNAPYKQKGKAVNPFNNYGILTFLSENVKRDKDGCVITNREEALKLLSILERQFVEDFALIPQ